MERIISARHPVPMRYVPRRGRVERLAFAQGATPVRLRELSAAEVPEAAMLRVKGRFGFMPLHVFEGALWRPVLCTPALKREQVEWNTLRTYDLVEWLEGGLAFHPEGPRHGATRHLSGTPLVARLYGTLGETRHDESFSPGHVRDMVEDGAGRAAAQVAAFFEEGILCAGERVFVRARGPMAVTPDHGVSYQVLPMPGAFEHYHVFREPLACNLSRVDAHAVAVRAAREMPPLEAPPALSWDPADVAGLPEGRDDLALFLNQAPRALIHDMPRPEEAVALAARMGPRDTDALRSLAAWGAVGCVREADAPEVFRLVREGYAHLREVRGSRYLGRDAEGFIERFAEPLASGMAAGPAPMADEDAEALSDLSPVPVA